MSVKRLGNQTVKFQTPPSIVSTASIVGPKEGQGPLKLFFDSVLDDEMWGEKSWEKAESKLIRETLSVVLKKANKSPGQINYVIAGDLLDQCIATTFGLREMEMPFLGIYGACSTMGESMSLGAMLLDGGFASDILCVTSSHFCSAEKQFRFPLVLGSQRTPSAQWTVTGSGAALLSAQGTGPYITHITTGKIVDKGVKDANNMGAAMAPAAIDTIIAHFTDTGFSPDKYDMIVTGDLGKIGREICSELILEQGYNISDIYNDCGLMIYDRKVQDTHAGGSGCGCCAVVFAGFLYKKLVEGSLKNILFVPTGALLSPVSTQQGETIPSIAHAISISTSPN
ncbi:MAG: stage V sporulation protein AD [Clostridium sp.]|nr:stage V sporulation protein AD [Clostridium sp.]